MIVRTLVYLRTHSKTSYCHARPLIPQTRMLKKPSVLRRKPAAKHPRFGPDTLFTHPRDPLNHAFGASLLWTVLLRSDQPASCRRCRREKVPERLVARNQVP